MSDPVFTAQDYLNAESVLDSLVQNMAIDCQLNMESWDRDTMQKHVNDRHALIRAKGLLLDEGERILKLSKP